MAVDSANDKAWMKTKKRCAKELEGLKKMDVVHCVNLAVNEGDRTVTFQIDWKGGKQWIYYPGAKFRLCFTVSAGYPFAGPLAVKFMHKVYHPSVDIDTGDICPDVLGTADWKPTNKVQKVITRLMDALITPGQEAPLNNGALENLKTNIKQFTKECKNIAKKYPGY